MKHKIKKVDLICPSCKGEYWIELEEYKGEGVHICVYCDSLLEAKETKHKYEYDYIKNKIKNDVFNILYDTHLNCAFECFECKARWDKMVEEIENL